MRDPRRLAKLVSREGREGTKKRAEKGRKTRGVEDESEGWLWTEWLGWIKRGKGGGKGENREYYWRDGSLVHISSYTYK